MSVFVIAYVSKTLNPRRGSQGIREFAPGAETREDHPDGSCTLTREVIDVTTGTPEPKYLYEYEDTIVECSKCGAEVSWTTLERDPDWPGYGRPMMKCPVCDEWNCCELVFQE